MQSGNDWYDVETLISNPASVMGRLVNVIGQITDVSGPHTTRNDYQTRLTLRDPKGYNIEFSIFNSDTNLLPPQSVLASIAIISRVKVQSRNGCSLLSNRETIVWFHKLHDFKNALFIYNPSQTLSDFEHPLEVLSKAQAFTDDNGAIASQVVLNKIGSSSQASRRMKDALIQDIQHGNWYNLTVYLTEDAQHERDRLSVMVTDFTRNQLLASRGITDYGDEGDYLSGNTHKNANGFPPDMVLEISLWETHRDTMLQHMPRRGQWWFLKNVKIILDAGNPLKGRISANSNFADDVYVHRLDPKTEAHTNSMLKAALKRRAQFQKGLGGGEASQDNRGKPIARSESNAKDVFVNVRRFVTQADPVLSDNQEKDITPTIDDVDQTTKNNGRARRIAEKSMIEQQEEETKKAVIPDNLNTEVRCRTDTDTPTPVSVIIKNHTLTTTIDGQEITMPLPFKLAKYLAVVRVVDFDPKDLRNFTYSSIKNLDGTDLIEPDVTFDERFHDRRWKWGFRLKLEDALISSAGKNYVWVNVNNDTAINLLDLDPVDLHQDEATLVRLKHQMMKLWGRLEEVKRAEIAAEASRGVNRRKRKARGTPPPPDSESEGDNRNAAMKRCNAESKPFKCCIQQYGVVMPTKDKSQANAGEMMMYLRQHLLFGTNLTKCLE